MAPKRNLRSASASTAKKAKSSPAKKGRKQIVQTPIFEYFEVPTVDEDQELAGPGKINEECFQRLGIFKTVNNVWKLQGELTAEESFAIPFLKGKPIPSSSNPTLPESRLEELEFGLDSLRREVIDMKHDLTDKLDGTYELLAIINSKVYQTFYLNALTHTTTGSIMPLDEDAATHPREKSGNVLFNCEQHVKNRPILRATHNEPTILTVEEYGVVKKYRKAEEQKRLDQMMKVVVFADDARRRWKAKAENVVRSKRSGRWIP